MEDKIETVTSDKQIIDNLYQFDKYRNDNDDWFRKRLSKGVNFAYIELNDSFIFAPSRFIGYANRSKEDHIEDKYKAGGKTDEAIKKILGEAKEDPDLEEKYKQLCAEVGATPEKKNRKFWRFDQFAFKSGNNSKKSSTNRDSSPGASVNLEHNDIQDALFKHLVSLYGKSAVGTEISSGAGGIDIVVKHDYNRFTFYEIKTALTAKFCIREAIGQLMEYAYWPKSTTVPQIEALVIVGKELIEKDGIDFLEHLRTEFSLPLFYQQFDMEKKELVTAP